MIWLPSGFARDSSVTSAPSTSRPTESQPVHPHPETFIDLDLSDAQARAEDAEAPSRNLYVEAQGDVRSSQHTAPPPPDRPVPVRRRVPRFGQAYTSRGQVLDVSLVRGRSVADPYGPKR
jgi:hypothetical protein